MKKTIILTLFCLLVATIAFATPAPAIFQLRLVLDAPSDDSERMSQTIHQGDQTFKQALDVQKTVLLDQASLKSAKASTDGLGQPIIEISLTDAGAKKFSDVTKQNIHKRLAIVIDGQLVEAPVIQTEIPDGQIQISGRFTREETKDLAKKISAAIKK